MEANQINIYDLPAQRNSNDSSTYMYMHTQCIGPEEQNQYELHDYSKSGEAAHFPEACTKPKKSAGSAGKERLFILAILLILLLLVAILGVVLFGSLHNSSCQSYCNFTSSRYVIETIQETARKVDDIRNLTEDLDHAKDNHTSLIMDALKTVLQTTGDSAQKLTNIVATLSALTDTSTSTAGVIDDILLVVAQLLELQNGSSLFLFNSKTPVSCNNIKTTLPHSPTGYYLVNGRNVYCNMDTLCGSGGGWTRLAYLNMNDSTASCPSGFRLYQSGRVRACGRATSSGASCQSVQFPSNGISYSQVCGRVVGYQFDSTNAVDVTLGKNHDNLNSWYVDGVSITRGSPRQHVWTLMAGISESGDHNTYNCPCTNGTTQEVQSFIDNHYFCESGNPNSTWQHIFYTSDPLWDGQGCGYNETDCCSAPGLPWFHRDYGNTITTDYIELRVCGDQGTDNEDVPVSYYEIYVK